jgi:hypothetical protein
MARLVRTATQSGIGSAAADGYSEKIVRDINDEDRKLREEKTLTQTPPL